MRINKAARDLAEDLGLSEADAVVMELKSKLYVRAAGVVKKSSQSHEAIAKKVGTSRARITRISNMGENSISMELLLKIIVTLEEKVPIRLTAA